MNRYILGLVSFFAPVFGALRGLVEGEAQVGAFLAAAEARGGHGAREHKGLEVGRPEEAIDQSGVAGIKGQQQHVHAAEAMGRAVCEAHRSNG